jgi:ATP-dependent Lon protease
MSEKEKDSVAARENFEPLALPENVNLKTYPFIPLKNVVVFPRVPIKLVIGSRSLVALEEAQNRYSSRIVVAAQRERAPKSEGETIASTNGSSGQASGVSAYLNELYQTGTLVEVTAVQRQTENGNSTEISVEGLGRVKIEKFLPLSGQPSRVQLVQVQELEEINTVPTPAIESLMRQVAELYSQLATLNSRVTADSVEQVSTIRRPSHLADYITSHMPKISSEKVVPEKQAILEELDVEVRLFKVCSNLQTEIELWELDGKIRNKVRQQIDRNQREFYLREQMKAIQDELGGELGNEPAEFRKKIEEKKLPPEVEEKMLKEVARLERMSSSSPESNVVRTYLDWVLALPWNESTEDNLDVRHAAAVLNADHYGLDKVKDRILEFLAVRSLTRRAEKKLKGPLLCFAGPPGVGKTSLGQSIAKSMGRKFVRISLGGVRDEAEIRGHRRTYVGALPGRIIAALKQAGSKNPIILLDEVDKMSSDFRGDPAAALLEVLDPEQNNAFVDHYIDLPFDLSEVLFITTANTLHTIPRPLLDRMEVIDIGGYTEDEKVQIAKRYLLPKQKESHALERGNLSITDKLLRAVIRNYTREAGVRNLERKIATVCRKAARLVVEGKAKRIRLSPEMLEDFLGVKRYPDTPDHAISQIGVAFGLAYTEHGGELLPVEVATMPGKGNLTITGRLGETMQESAKAAMSYARSRSKELGIDIAQLEKIDMHIHLPEGAVPKDGPSAGITMATALISALSGLKARSDTAMTGEITLRGRVLPIGGLKEKSLAAHRGGMKRIIAPLENKRDLREIPKVVQKELEWIWVESMDEVVKEILLPKEEGEVLPMLPEAAATTVSKPASKPEKRPTTTVPIIEPSIHDDIMPGR